MDQVTDEDLRFQCIVAARDSFQPDTPVKKVMARANAYYKFIRIKNKEPKKKIIGFGK